MARGFEDLHIFFTAPLLHCSFAKHNARGNMRASLSSSSLVKEPVTFHTDFVARQQQPSNINMTVAPLDSETTSSDTSSSDACPDSSTECSSSQALPSLAYKCSLHGFPDQKLSTPPISTSSALSSSDASTPDDTRRLTSSPGAPTNNIHSADSGVSANDNTVYSGKLTSSFSNLTTSLYDLDSGDCKHDSDSSPAKVMTTSFTNLTCNDSGALPGSRPPQSLSSMPDLSEGVFGKRNTGRWSSPGWRGHRASSVSCRAFWARANAVMLYSHKWLNDFVEGPKPQLKGSVIMAGPGLRLVELRDLNTLMFHHWEWVGRKAPPVLHLKTSTFNTYIIFLIRRPDAIPL
ncbi:hypothetical protein FHG87_023815 [Trinorchestia longiramus]|nr:hypothetical protein FHG87_023815 [Trinorchestia longiramus]